MAREIPEIVRAAAGLAATVLDEARRLPATLPSLPIRLLGLAMQQAMRIQQQYAGLVARGDEVFTGLRGDAEPGLATFDDDDEDDAGPAATTTPGFRDSAFDRTETSGSDATSGLVAVLPDPAADAVPGVDAIGDEVETSRSTIEEAADEAPATAEILDEIAIDELVDQAPTLEETAPSVTATPAATPAAGATVDVLTPDGDIATVDATVTDEGVAAPAAPAAPAGDDATATDESGTPVAAATAGSGGATGDAAASNGASAPPAATTAPVDGYDSFSVAQLRGRLRGYALSTVEDLVAYEEATRAREPYLRMLRNRLEKLEEQAVVSSPLAPRGA
ncbi:MAG: hypothetical protein ACLGI3_14015 [Actinomycetes bacterium]